MGNDGSGNNERYNGNDGSANRFYGETGRPIEPEGPTEVHDALRPPLRQDPGNTNPAVRPPSPYDAPTRPMPTYGGESSDSGATRPVSPATPVLPEEQNTQKLSRIKPDPQAAPGKPLLTLPIRPSGSSREGKNK